MKVERGYLKKEESELGGQIVLEHVLDGLDGLFRILYTAEQVAVSFRNKKLHNNRIN